MAFGFKLSLIDKNLCNEEKKECMWFNLSDGFHFLGFQGPRAVHFSGSETQNQFVKQEITTTSTEYLSVF